jgi:hypothetical protein
MTPIERVQNFVSAGVAMGRVKMLDAMKEFEETGHSCYQEGYAGGFGEAMKIVLNFVDGVIADEAAKQ